MLKINTNSWHYKFAYDVHVRLCSNWTMPNDLCNYFYIFPKAFFLWAIFSFIGAGIGIWALIYVVSPIVTYLFSLYVNQPFLSVIPFHIFLTGETYYANIVDWTAHIVIYGLALFIGLIVGIVHFSHKVTELSFVNVVQETISAKKQKYCPKIEYVESENK